jgi:hypothetical protein
MSTRSLVVGAESTVARYVHSDGYPEHMVPALKLMIKRDGIKVILANNWSSIGANPQPNLNNRDLFIKSDYYAADAEYVYEIDESTIKSFVVTGEGLVMIEEVNV